MKSIPEHIKSRLFFDTSLVCASVVQTARSQFLKCLELSDISNTRNSCVYGSYFLNALISRFHPDLICRIVGGGHESATGVHLGDGLYVPHCWVEIEDQGICYTADITCDQFGFPDIVLCPSALTGQIFCKDNQEITDQMLSEIESEDEFYGIFATAVSPLN